LVYFSVYFIEVSLLSLRLLHVLCRNQVVFVVLNVFKVDITHIAASIFLWLWCSYQVRLFILQGQPADCLGYVALPISELFSQNFKFLALKEGHVGLDPFDAEEPRDNQLTFLHFKNVLIYVSSVNVAKHEDLVSWYKR